MGISNLKLREMNPGMWHVPVIPTLRRRRQEDLFGQKAKPSLMKSAPRFLGWPRATKYQASLGYLAKTLKKVKRRKKMK